MQLKVFTIVGTSLYRDLTSNTHYIALEKERASAYDSCCDRINKIRPSMKKIIKDNKSQASAEFESSVAIKKKFAEDEIRIILLATDTVLSRLAAEVIAEIINEENIVEFKGISAEFDNTLQGNVIKGLQIDDCRLFEKEGVPNLVEKMDKLKHNINAKEMLLNITGGYKALTPYMTIFAQINNIPLYYIFENTGELIKIPQVPLTIDNAIFSRYRLIFQELAVGIIGKSWQEYSREKGIEYEAFYDCVWEENDSGTAMLSLNAIGKMLWEKYKDMAIIKVPKINFSYHAENNVQKNELRTAFKRLWERLSECNMDLNKLPKDEVTSSTYMHCSIGDNTCIYKYASGSWQIRVHYTTRDNELWVLNYKFKRGSNTYKNELSEEYKKMGALSAEKMEDFLL